VAAGVEHHELGVAHLELVAEAADLADEQPGDALGQLGLPPREQVRLAEEGELQPSVAVGEGDLEPARGGPAAGLYAALLAVDPGDPGDHGDVVTLDERAEVGELGAGEVAPGHVPQQVADGLDPQPGELLRGAVAQHLGQRRVEGGVHPRPPPAQLLLHDRTA
jgi:hypothetical protein